MTTREDLENELIARLEVSDNSSLFPSTRITSLIKDAYIWATQLFYWHDLVRARCTSTSAGYEYYDYPENFRSESIIRMEVDDKEYLRKNFEDYQAYKKANPGTNKKMFASFGRQFFINPTPTVTGDNNIVIWGAIQADALESSTSVSIFSYNKEEANEAVIKKAMSVALARSDAAQAKQELGDAVVILTKIAQDESANTQRNARLDHAMFNVPNFFGNRRSTSFNCNTEEE